MKILNVALLAILSGCGSNGPGGVGGGNDAVGGGTAAGGGGAATGGGTGAGGGIGAEFDREALSGTRLKQRYLQGDDGSRTPLGFFDTMRNEACSFGVAEDGKQRCLPADLQTFTNSSFFFDGGCVEKIGYSPFNCTDSKYALETLAIGCPIRTAIYAVTLYTPTNVYSGKPGSCSAVAVTNYPNHVWYRLGAKIPAISFAAATIMVEP